MIDVFCNSHIGVQKFSTAEEVLQNERESRLSSEVYGAEDTATNGKYVLCLWNDQKHSFSDALNVILGATHKTVEFGKMVSRKIDSNGRAMVILSDDLPMLMEKKRKMEKTGLVNTVRSSKDYFREEMCATICYWLDDLSKSSLKSNYFVLREIMSKVLCTPWNYGTEQLRSGNVNEWNNVPIDEDSTSLIRSHSSLNGPYIPDISQRTIRTKSLHVRDPDYESGEDDVIFEDEEEGRVDEGDEDEDAQRPQQVAGEEYMEFDRVDEVSDEINMSTGPSQGEMSGIRGSEMDVTGTSSDNASSVPGIQAAPSKVWKQTGPTPPPPFNPRSPMQVSARVQYLIFFDIRLWKDLRLTLRDLYISILVSNPEYKILLGHFYAQLYPQIAELYMLVDREPECSIISSLSTQLFTTPSIATDLLKYDYFTKLIAALYTFFTSGEVGPPTAADPEGYIALDSKVLKNRRFGQLFHDVEYLLNRNTEKDLVSCNVDRISQVAEFMLLFQGMSPLRRQKDKHIEFESELWIYFFNAVPYVLQLAIVVASGIGSCHDPAKVSQCVGKVVGIVASWAQGDYTSRFKAAEVIPGNPQFTTATVKFSDKIVSVENIDFKVENQWVSLHHPLNSYLSWLIEYASFEDAATLRKVLVSGIKNHLSNKPGLLEDENLLQLVFEHPIRVLSLLSQIHIGLWVRNGYSVRSQLHHYRDFTLRDSAFVRDVFMAQAGLVVLRPNTIMMQLLSRFSLLDWQFNKLFDDSQRMYMVEEFLHHLIYFLMERTQLMGYSEKEVKRKYIVKEIIQCLAFKDMAFSDICKTVPDPLSGDEMFETILREIAIYKAPTGVRDYGLYQLKTEYYSEFDTHYIHFSSAKIEEAESMIKSKIHKTTGQPLESVVHEPPLKPITSGPFAGLAGFSRTVPFGKFAYDLLSYIMAHRAENANEGALGQLLQLFHVIALDDLEQKPASPFATSFSSLAALVCASSNVEQEYPTIMSYLCKMLELNEFSDFSAKIRRIINLLRQREPELVDPLVISLTSADVFTRDSTPKPDDAGAAERKKKLGQERKAQVLAEFQNRQKQFAQLNMTDDMDLDNDADMKETGEGFEEADDNEWLFPESQCILCRMPDDNKPGNNNVFGLMGYVMLTNVVRKVPLNDKDWVYEALGNDKNLDDDISVDDIDKAGNANWQKYRHELHQTYDIGPGFPSHSTDRTAIMTGCGHGVHFQCYQDYLKSTRNRGQQLTRNNPEDTSRGEYLCPLCRALNNTFLPVLWKSNKLAASDYLRISDPSALENLGQMIQQGSFDEFTTVDQYNERIFREGTVNMNPSYAHLMGMGSENSFPDVKLDKAISEPIQRIYQARFQQESHPDAAYVDDVNGMVDCLAGTISALEVSLRGKGYSNPMGGIVMDQIPTQSLQMIRVFGELCKTYISYATTLCENPDDESYVKNRHPSLYGQRSFRLRNPLDSSYVTCFQDFASAALLTAPASGVEVGPMLRAYCTGAITHILKTVIGEVARKAPWVWNERVFDLPGAEGIDVNDVETAKTLETLAAIITAIRPHVETTPDTQVHEIWSKPEFVQVVYSILRKCLAPFLRKCAIFVFAICGNYDPYDFMGFGKEFPEIDKLCEYLGLESVNALIRAIAQPPSEGGVEEMVFQKYASRGFNMFSSELEYPSVVRLLRLPKRLDDFFNLRNKSLAGKVTTDLVADPAVCLFCGVSVGMQTPAFDNDPTTGQCQEHARQCGKDVGIFLLPKRSSMLLLKGPQGSFSEGPYLDLHGEADETMR
ncbi:E3 ubiquitin-protein ligase UBR1 [Sugiyamaella lignohabitans]|uniref:E3 ubiquitin-protein ligase n=1 Tax=Sugiyamaella lignohabitans TaxID=796027 RepID=A0A167CG78_9ASCO|nr:E3 ubiquitin-protein ligase UBR1 [Sugiyamaella lignohabitans]ANB11646.1 E3 ubiquitin-protein ligase UBR1 [Sugiyamaella lignohabitans]